MLGKKVVQWANATVQTLPLIPLKAADHTHTICLSVCLPGCRCAYPRHHIMWQLSCLCQHSFKHEGEPIPMVLKGVTVPNTNLCKMERNYMGLLISIALEGMNTFKSGYMSPTVSGSPNRRGSTVVA